MVIKAEKTQNAHERGQKEVADADRAPPLEKKRLQGPEKLFPTFEPSSQHWPHSPLLIQSLSFSHHLAAGSAL